MSPLSPLQVCLIDAFNICPQVRYRAGADTGFVIENQAELDEFLVRSAALAESNTAATEDDLEVTKYSGELADNISFRQVRILLIYRVAQLVGKLGWVDFNP